MRHDFKIKGRAIVLLLALLIAADVALGVYTWNLASEQTARQELALLMRNRQPRVQSQSRKGARPDRAGH